MKGISAASMMALSLAGVMATGACAFGTSDPRRTWTIRDEVEVPAVMETAMSRDGKVGLVLVRTDHLDTNSREFRLLGVDIGRKQMQPRLAAKWISRIDAIPNSSDWSLLADLGEGVQLYRLTRDFRIKPIKVRRRTVTIGADTAVAVTPSIYDFDQAFGVFDYGWSPDGKSYWYSTAHVVSKGYQKPSVQLAAFVPYTILPSQVSELHVASLNGDDRIIASAPGRSIPHTVVAFQESAAYWDEPAKGGALGLNFSMPTGEDGSPFETVPKHYDPASRRITDGNASPANNLVGSHGGSLHETSANGVTQLSEDLPEGRQQSYGRVDFPIGGFWSSRGWYYPSFGMSILPTRHGMPYRSDLVRLDREGKVTSLEPSESLTHCALAENQPTGVCIQESLNDPPSVVTVDAGRWRAEPVGPLDARYAAISPLTYVQKVWTVGDLSASGFVVLPRDYKPGGRYPAILLTHGYDADDTFAYWALQWSYPVQVWAERGYVVLCVNDIPVGQSAERKAAYLQWDAGQGDMSAAQVAQVVWLDQLRIYQQALTELSADGTIDPARVGIVGYSRGSQMTNVAVTQTRMFAAASSGDGSYFAPSSYWVGDNQVSYRGLFSGAPGHAGADELWRSLSPAYRADQVTAPVLFQVAFEKAGIQDFFGALQEANVPAEFMDFHNETHLFHYPLNRAIAMEENLDWFDYWLRGVRDPTPAKDEQYKRWDSLRARWKQADTGSVVTVSSH